MSVTAQSSVFSVAVQAAKVGSANIINVAGQDWYRTRAPRIGIGSQQMQETFPLETGGPIVPTGAFKSGQYPEGDVELIPRAEEFLGILLHGAVGLTESAVDSVYDPATETLDAATYTGVNSHRFRFAADGFTQPWLAARVRVPGATSSDVYGEVHQDMKIQALRLNIPAAGLLGATVSMRGLKSHFPVAADVNAWAYENSAEDSLSAPHSGKGSFKIGGVSYPITSASIELANNLTSAQQEMIVGSYHPDDLVSLTRALQIRIVYKWENPQLYKRLLTGSPTGVNWDSLPFLQDTSGATKAFEATFQSPGTIPGVTGGTLPYQLRVEANRVVWQIDRGGIELQAGNIIQVPYVGTVLEPAAGEDYLAIYLQNAATYAFAGVWS
jgi:hypothetical protein